MTPEDMEAQIAAIAADNVAIEDYRAKFGDTEAAKFAADLYKLRRTPAPVSPAPTWSGLPRSIIILIAIWVGLLETADKLPRLLLAYPGYEATLAEYQAKMMQPDITAAQLEKAKLEAKASACTPAPTPPKVEAKAAPAPTENAAPTPEAPPAPPKAEANAAPPTDLSPSDKHKLNDLINRNVPAPAPEPAASAAPAPLRTPTAFDCAKASMGSDYVICASPQLMDAEARLEDALHAAHVAKGDEVMTEQWAWIKRYGADCGLPLKGRPADEKIQGAAGCVRSAMEQRIKELQAEQ